MNSIVEKVKSLPSEAKEVIAQRLNEFSAFSTHKDEEWFSELCFCLLTANSKAKTALSLQKNLGFKGFYNFTEEELSGQIKVHKHRFHNTKAARIVEARMHFPLKEKIKTLHKTEGSKAVREWLVSNVKGLGYKEASHFLRNTGHFDIAIIDRHILSILNSHNLIDEKPKSITKKVYLEMELLCAKLAQRLNMSLAQLDLCLWYLETGQILK